MKLKDIEVGMTLRRRSGAWVHCGMKPGDTGVVEWVSSDTVKLEGNNGEHDPNNLELVENPKPKVLPIFN